MNCSAEFHLGIAADQILASCLLLAAEMAFATLLDVDEYPVGMRFQTETCAWLQVVEDGLWLFASGHSIAFQSHFQLLTGGTVEWDMVGVVLEKGIGLRREMSFVEVSD